MFFQSCLLLASGMFCIGLYGVLTSRNVVRVLMSLEVLLNAVNLNLITFSNFVDSHEMKGQVLALFVIALAAAEAAIGLAIILSIYRNQRMVDPDQFNLLKW